MRNYEATNYTSDIVINDGQPNTSLLSFTYLLKRQDKMVVEGTKTLQVYLAIISY